MSKKKQTIKHLEKNSSGGVFDKIQNDLEKNNSYLNLVLGTLIVIVLGILIFNYFNKPEGDIGSSDQTVEQQTPDVKKEELPGKYVVKKGDTLFSIAKDYYNDGYKYPKLVETNKLTDENQIEVGQVLDIPKLEQADQAFSDIPSTPPNDDKGTGGAINQTAWGEKITGDTYTVTKGDWLSKIAGRAYGNIYMYDKIAKANNLQNPDSIEVGIVLKIPR